MGTGGAAPLVRGRGNGAAVRRRLNGIQINSSINRVYRDRYWDFKGRLEGCLRVCRLCGCVRLCVSRLTLRFPSPNNIFTPPIQSSTRLVALRECRIAKVHWKFEHFNRACADIPSVELEGEPHHAINAVVLHLIEQVRREKERAERKREGPTHCVLYVCACVYCMSSLYTNTL